MSENISNLPTIPTGEELEETRAFLESDDWQDIDIDNDWLDPEDEWEVAKNALFVDDAPVCALGGLTILGGQSGNGKTMTLAMMISAIFKTQYGQLRVGTEIESPRVLYIDTEMEKYNTQRLMNRVYYINGWAFKTQHPEFRILRLRDTVDVEERWKKVLKAIFTVNPTFCILDGLIDLVRDFNDNVECQNLVYKLMAAASWYNMSVIGVVHLNPGGEKMAGHLGSFAERKAICTLISSKDKTTGEIVFKVQQKKARDKDADDMLFRVNDDNLHIGIPEPINGDVVITSKSFTNEQLKGWLSECMQTGMAQPFKLDDLRTVIKGVTNEKRNENVQTIIDTAKHNKYIVQQPKSEILKGMKPKWYFGAEIQPF